MKTNGRISAERLSEVIGSLIYDHEAEVRGDLVNLGGESEVSDIRVETYEEAGLMTRDKGLVVTLRPTGQKFQITIVDATR